MIMFDTSPHQLEQTDKPLATGPEFGSNIAINYVVAKDGQADSSYSPN